MLFGPRICQTMVKIPKPKSDTNHEQNRLVWAQPPYLNLLTNKTDFECLIKKIQQINIYFKAHENSLFVTNVPLDHDLDL